MTLAEFFILPGSALPLIFCLLVQNPCTILHAPGARRMYRDFVLRIFFFLPVFFSSRQKDDVTQNGHEIIKSIEMDIFPVTNRSCPFVEAGTEMNLNTNGAEVVAAAGSGHMAAFVAVVGAEDPALVAVEAGKKAVVVHTIVQSGLLHRMTVELGVVHRSHHKTDAEVESDAGCSHKNFAEVVECGADHSHHKNEAELEDGDYVHSQMNCDAHGRCGKQGIVFV